MIKLEVIRRRLNNLEDYLAILKQLQRYSLEEFLENPERYGSAERFLQLAIEAGLDIASHVIAERHLGAIESYRDIPRIFAKAALIDPQQEKIWLRMIGFRNILVHEYSGIDRKLVFEVLQNGIDDLHMLRKVFARFL